MFVNSGKELEKICSEEGISICEYTLRSEEQEGRDRNELIKSMRKVLSVMRESSKKACEKEIKSISGLIGGDAVKLSEYSKSDNSFCGSFMVKVMARALSSSEVNAAMGKIVAAPTAGSCGILPAVIISACEKLQKDDDDIINALFTSSGIGILIAKNASLSGAEGGCQAECGSAAAMGAAAAVEMAGGSPHMALDAAAIVIKNVLGLVCDPVAGLVEIPCAKRNVFGAVESFIASDMVMSGIKSKIPFDDAVSAMNKVGRQMPCELKETAMGGLAATKTGIRLKNYVLKGC